MDAEQNKKKSGIGWKIFFSILFALSVLANFVLLILLIAATAMWASSTGQNHFIEKVIQPVRSANKIAVIRIEGIINNGMSEDFAKQIKAAEKDNAVKAVIIRTITPGGTITASDEIHNEILKFKKNSGKPIVAFMQGLAASGGYYTSAACDKIIAEPTTITGSIGVIMGHFVIQELLEEKLGIKPAVFKSGERKNWPTSFEPVTEEQIKYLNDKLITPAYERFVNIVAQGRETLTYEKAKELADGSIYNATEALQNKLIDEIGYIDEAVNLAKSLAGIDNAKIVEYTKPFSIKSLLGANTLLGLNKNTIYEMTTPQLMYIWDAGLCF